MVGFDDSRGGEDNDFHIHVELAEKKPFFLSVYFVAKSTESKHVIYTMDLDTKNIIAPGILIHNYTKGVWWTVRYDKSIKLHFENIKGIRFSALAFAT
jgi:hypothetical protein